MSMSLLNAVMYRKCLLCNADIITFLLPLHPLSPYSHPCVIFGGSPVPGQSQQSDALRILQD
jgi:hypothetical protein